MLERLPSTRTPNNESGFALLMVVFVLTLASILVTTFSVDTHTFIRSSRTATDTVEGRYAALSTLELALSVLEIPENQALPLEPWQLLNSLPALPVPGYLGELRVQIIDEASRINVNAIADSTGIQSTVNSNQSDILPATDRWKNVLRNLFQLLNYDSVNSYGLGLEETKAKINVSLDQQIAIIHDWIDADSSSYSSPNFSGQGIESQNDTRFLNRSTTTIDELQGTPGLSNVFLKKLAPFIRSSSSGDALININTAPPLVLTALGFSEDQVQNIIEKRQVQKITPEELDAVLQGLEDVREFVTTKSNGSFRIIIRAKSAATTTWLEAECVRQSGFGNSAVSIRRVRFL